jgi:hypothetical protein
MGLGLPAPVEQLGLLFLALEKGISVQEHIDPEQVSPRTYVDVSELIIKALIALARAREATRRPGARTSVSTSTIVVAWLANSPGVPRPASRRRSVSPARLDPRVSVMRIVVAPTFRACRSSTRT